MTEQKWSPRLHRFYRMALLLPFLGMAVAAVLMSYPPFLMRGLAAYGIVLLWLHHQLQHRSLREFDLLLRQGPTVYASVSTALLGALVLTHEQAAQFMNEHAAWIELHLAAQLVIGYGYVGIIGWTRNILQASGYFVESENEPALSTAGRS